MDADEGSRALKKAFDDVVLNISEESAARVMAADRKSSRYHHELNMAREEGARMLLRMKQMMDSKISESEASSSNQQKKIEELEAQLHEAEDIVKDLRDELVQVHAELERVNTEKSQHVNEPENAWSREIQEEGVEYSYPSANESSIVAYDVITAPYHRCDKCYNKLVCTCGAYIGNRDLPSIISRSKEVGSHRNGCKAQRIRACERNLSDRQLCLSEEKLVSENLGEPEKKLVSDIELSGTQSCEEERNFEESGLAESLLSLACKVDVEKTDTPSNNLEGNSYDIIKSLPCQSVNVAPVKFTYQRKRKRQALSGSVEIEKKTRDEQNCDQKVDQSNKSSRESRRVAQVARQLLSLSDKKWWN